MLTKVDFKKNFPKYMVLGLPMFMATVNMFKDKIADFAHSDVYPDCYFRRATGYLCQGCGNTRSVLSLLNGDILASLKYNITPIVALIFLLLFYSENVAAYLGKHIVLIPKKISFLTIVLVLLSAYYILRNVFPWLSILNK